MAEFLNKNIKYLRATRGISQQSLAEKTGIDRSTISRIENNETETSIDTAINIAKALNISLRDLIGRDLSVNNDTNTYHKLESLLDVAEKKLTKEEIVIIENILKNASNRN